MSKSLFIQTARRLGSSFIPLALLCLLGVPAHASMMLPMSVAELSRGADLVAQGKVIRTESRLSAGGGRIFTVVTFEVAEAWKGGGAGSQVEIHVPGGTVDGISQVVMGAAHFVEGEEAVVFLRELRPSLQSLPAPITQVVGMAQGKLEVEVAPSGERIAVQRLEGLELVDPQSHQLVTPPVIEPIPLQALKAQVQAVGR